MLDTIRGRLNDGQLAWFMPDIATDEFLDELRLFGAESVLRSIARRVADRVEQMAIEGGTSRRGYEHSAIAADLLWDRGLEDEAIELWSLLAVVAPELFSDGTRLQAVAECLPAWIPSSRGSLRADNLPEGMRLNGVVPIRPAISPRVVRAANLLAEFPSAKWVTALKRSWLAVEDLVRRDRDGDEPESDHQRLMAACSVAAALGTCASRDRTMRVLVEDDGKRKRRYEALDAEIHARNTKIDEYRVLVQRHHAGEEVLDTIQTLRDNIDRRDTDIARARQELRESMSPGALLLQTVADAQAFPVEARQGAAWGLHRMVTDGVLERSDQERIRAVLHQSLQDEETDDSALRDQVAAAFPIGDERVRVILAAAERYASNHDAEELTAAVSRLAPEAPLLAVQVRETIDQSKRAGNCSDFSERLVRLSPGAGLLELTAELRRALRWMVELGEGSVEAGEAALIENLLWIAVLIRQELPGLVDFVARYPLRLMTLRRHRQILGQYTRDKLRFQLWTRYTPPRWFRGARPNEVGEVRLRHLDLDDRSVPNGMGIYYRLFEHPLLALPVLYHEFLHYGGPAGNPEHGIDNETEVLLREIVFARHLVSRLAPALDVELPAYERALAETIERTELIGLAHQLFLDFQDDHCWAALNQEVVSVYGEGFETAAASAEVERRIEYWNRTIDLENATNATKRSWYPTIEWPRLGGHDTHRITARFRDVLVRTLQMNHVLSREARDGVLDGAPCRDHQDEWLRYRERPYALEGFAEHFTGGVASPVVLNAIVHRFQLVGRDVWFELTDLLAALGLGGLTDSSSCREQ